MEKTVIVVSALCIKQGKVLLLLRSKKNSSYKGVWQLPEGKLEFGESPKEALVREAKEEIGINLKIQDLVGAYSSIAYKLGKKYHIIRLLYRGSFVGEVKLSGDHSEFGWFGDLTKIKIMPGIRKMVEKDRD